MAETGLVQILEGALLAAGKPMTVAQLAELFEEAERPDKAALREALQEVNERCDDRGFELVEVASGFRYQVRQNLSPWIARLWTERPQKYSRALLETLALIAYRQPITRGEIEEIRGVAVSSNIVKTLHEREWIRVVGHRDVPGRPAMYATTRQFLDYFSLNSLDQLPALAEIRDLETLNTELGFSEPLPEGSDDPKETGPELTVVGGKDHVPQAEEPASEMNALRQESAQCDDPQEEGEQLESSDAGDAMVDTVDTEGTLEGAAEPIPQMPEDDGVSLAEAVDDLEARAAEVTEEFSGESDSPANIDASLEGQDSVSERAIDAAEAEAINTADDYSEVTPVNPESQA